MSETLEYHDRDSNVITIEPTTEWVNYGGANPKLHGGNWVRWEGDMWHIIKTTHPNDLPQGMTDNEQLIQEYWVEPMDLFEGGNPDNGPTKFFSDVIDSLSNVSGYVNALVDFDIEYFVSEWSYYYHSHRDEWVDDAEYWDYLSEYGITDN